MGLPTQSSKGLRVATQCRDVEQFVRTYHRFCEDSGVFIGNARRSVGEVIAFSFELADGSAALSGLGAVVEQFATADNRFGRPGVVIALHRLARNARRVFDDLTAARASAKDSGERRDTTPMPFVEPRAYTSDFQMLDAENLTPIPQLPPRPTDAFPPLPKPLAAKVPDVPAMPVMSRTATVSTDGPAAPLKSRASTVSIAAIAVRPPATRTPPPGIKIPVIVAPTPPIVATIAEGTTPPPAPVAAEVADTASVDEQPAVIHAPRVVVEAPLEAIAAPADAVIEQPDAMAEQTVRMATPPYGALVAREPEAPVVVTAAAYESGVTEAPRLSPAPLDLLAAPAPVVEATSQPDAFEHISAAIAAVATEPPAPVPMPAVPVSVVFAPKPPPASTRWTKRRIWAVAALAGASLLALGVVIGATFAGGGTRVARPESASVVAPTPAATPTAPPPAPTTAAASPTPPAPTPVAETATPTEPPAPASVAKGSDAAPPPPETAAAAPANAVAKAPAPAKTPPKKPAHAKHHHHSSPAGCTSLKCL